MQEHRSEYGQPHKLRAKQRSRAVSGCFGAAGLDAVQRVRHLAERQRPTFDDLAGDRGVLEVELDTFGCGQAPLRGDEDADIGGDEGQRDPRPATCRVFVVQRKHVSTLTVVSPPKVTHPGGSVRRRGSTRADLAERYRDGSMSRRRLDAELVRRGLVSSRQAARDAVDAGRVAVGGAPAFKVARLVSADEPVTLAAVAAEYVSRGGHKLAAALDAFDIDVASVRALDAGASTGGFTDCLLQRGARHVVAVDVGYGQLAHRLREDPRVEVRERTNVRYLTAGDVEQRVDLVVGDLSFISLTTVMPALLDVSTPTASMVLLVKPQFEAGRAEVAKGSGVIRDPEVWRSVCMQVVTQLVELSATSAGPLAVRGFAASPVRGPEGNREFLVHFERNASDECGLHLADRVDRAVAEALAAEQARV